MNDNFEQLRFGNDLILVISGVNNKNNPIGPGVIT